MDLTEEFGPHLEHFYEGKDHTVHPRGLKQHHSDRRDHEAALDESLTGHYGAANGHVQHVPANWEHWEGWPVCLKKIPAMKKVLSDLYELDSSAEEDESPFVETDKQHRGHGGETSTIPANAKGPSSHHPGQLVRCSKEEWDIGNISTAHHSVTTAECNIIPCGMSEESFTEDKPSEEN